MCLRRPWQLTVTSDGCLQKDAQAASRESLSWCVPFWLRDSCVCVHSCMCLYLYTHSCLYACGNTYFHFLELEVALPYLFAIALDFFLVLFVSNPFYN